MDVGVASRRARAKEVLKQLHLPSRQAMKTHMEAKAELQKLGLMDAFGRHEVRNKRGQQRSQTLQGVLNDITKEELKSLLNDTFTAMEDTKCKYRIQEMIKGYRSKLRLFELKAQSELASFKNGSTTASGPQFVQRLAIFYDEVVLMLYRQRKQAQVLHQRLQEALPSGLNESMIPLTGLVLLNDNPFHYNSTELRLTPPEKACSIVEPIMKNFSRYEISLQELLEGAGASPVEGLNTSARVVPMLEAMLPSTVPDAPALAALKVETVAPQVQDFVQSLIAITHTQNAVLQDFMHRINEEASPVIANKLQCDWSESLSAANLRFAGRVLGAALVWFITSLLWW